MITAGYKTSRSNGAHLIDDARDALADVGGQVAAQLLDHQGDVRLRGAGPLLFG